MSALDTFLAATAVATAVATASPMKVADFVRQHHSAKAVTSAQRAATAADNERAAKELPGYLADWHEKEQARYEALSPARGPLFQGRKFVALDTQEHEIHRALHMWNADRSDDDAQVKFETQVMARPAAAVRYLNARAQALGEDWSRMVRVLNTVTKVQT